MGLLISRLLGVLFTKKPLRILMLGLDGAGKTSILYKLKLNEFLTTIPTVGFNVERVEYKNISFTMWDVGGQDRIRALWRFYYENTDALIFVVDSNDVDRINEARKELQLLMSEQQLNKSPLLVLANKQDLNKALSVTQIAGQLGLTSMGLGNWHIQGTSAMSGEGLCDGLDWLANATCHL